MKREHLGRAVLIACFAIAGVGAKWLFAPAAAAQSSQPQARSLPMFEVDASWPKVPAKWKLGDASSIAIDANDNVWVLHRPRTLKPDQAAMAAPPIIVFDAAGNYLKSWGGAGTVMTGPNASTAFPSTTRASCGWAETIVRRRYIRAHR
jgi:hypothetical protein